MQNGTFQLLCIPLKTHLHEVKDLNWRKQHAIGDLLWQINLLKSTRVIGTMLCNMHLEEYTIGK
jgi:hypothetical protein